MTTSVCTNRLEIWGDPAQLSVVRGIILAPDGSVCLADLSPDHGGVIDYEHMTLELRKRDIIVGYGTIGRPFPGLFWQEISRHFSRLTFANTYMENFYCFAGVSVWRKGRKLYERYIQDYRAELPDPEVYDQDYYDDCLIDLMVTLQLEAAVFT